MATAITVVCPQCNNRMRASSEHIGRKGRCPACKSLVEITAPAGEGSLVTLRPVRAPGAPREGDTRLASTNVPVWLAGVIGAAITTVLYLTLFLPMKGRTYFGDLFADRGPMQHCTTLVTCWGLALLVMKYLAVKRQLSYAELELEVIPLEIGLQITSSNVDQFLGHVNELPQPVRQSILGRRIQGALEHFKSRTSVPEVQQYLATQAELDSSSVDSGYSLLRSFIWVVPLLGFIGTVTGISSAVTGLDAALKKGTSEAVATAPDTAATPATTDAASSDQAGAAAAPKKGTGQSLLDGLGLVTHGLAVAFDTTFLALVMAIVLLFPTETLRKIEYGMLDRIEAFTNESLLRRLSDEHAPAGGDEMPEIVRGALEAAFHEHQRWLAQWQAQVGQLGQLIGADFEAAVNRVQDQVSKAESVRLQNYEGLVRLVDTVFEKAQRAPAVWQQSEQQAVAMSREFLAAAAQLQHTLAENIRLCQDVSQQQNRMWQLYSEGSLGPNMLALAEQIGKLAAKLDGAAPAAGRSQQSGEEMLLLEPISRSSSEIAITPPAEAPRRGLFARLWGRG